MAGGLGRAGRADKHAAGRHPDATQLEILGAIGARGGRGECRQRREGFGLWCRCPGIDLQHRALSKVNDVQHSLTRVERYTAERGVTGRGQCRFRHCVEAPVFWPVRRCVAARKSSGGSVAGSIGGGGAVHDVADGGENSCLSGCSTYVYSTGSGRAEPCPRLGEGGVVRVWELLAYWRGRVSSGVRDTKNGSGRTAGGSHLLPQVFGCGSRRCRSGRFVLEDDRRRLISQRSRAFIGYEQCHFIGWGTRGVDRRQLRDQRGGGAATVIG